MNEIDMYGYVKRFPKFGELDILFLGDYIEKDPIIVLKSVLAQGFDVVLIDSMAEVCTNVVDFHGGTNKNANHPYELEAQKSEENWRKYVG